MEKYLDLHAPQWVDFTTNCSPERMSDFFEKVHAEHERIEDCDSTSKNMEDTQSTSQVDVSHINTKAQADLDIIKNTPVRVVSPKRHNKETVTMETTYNQVLTDAMKKLELCKKPLKVLNPLNKTIQEPNTFKTPNTIKFTKSSKSIGFNSVPNKRIHPGQDFTPRYAKTNKSVCTPNNTSANIKKTSISQSLFKQDKDCTADDSKTSNNPINDPKGEEDKQPDGKVNESQRREKSKKEDDKEPRDESEEAINSVKDNKEISQDNKEEDSRDNPEEDSRDNPEEDSRDNPEEDSQDNVDAAIKNDNQTQPLKKIAVRTWHNHRRSMYKPRNSFNKPYVSLAEAVSRFQNETPKRFRTKSNKDNTATSLNLSKLMQNRVRPTIPISPALISKNRTRPVTALSQDEREGLEMEEIKKHQIKANPIPPNVLRGPRTTTRVTKKPTTIARPSSAMQRDEKACAASSLQPKNLSPHHDKAPSGSKNTVMKVVVTDPAGFIVEHEKMTFFGVPTGIAKNVTRVVPFSFEARDKNLQMKKEQRLKDLQEANKSKTEFHAKPAPDFSKPPTPQAKQQQNVRNSTVRVPILPCPFSFEKRNKNLSKKKEQLAKQVIEDKPRVFRANPVPVFKPVMVRGKSKEHIARDKNAKTAKEQAEKCEDQENKEPNIRSSTTESAANKPKAPLKARPLELNTDKRARERREFDEKLKRKEMEEEAKRQLENKKQLERERQMKVELRKRTEMKARPMPTYKPIIIAKATKQLTEPQSPAFLKQTKPKEA